MPQSYSGLYYHLIFRTKDRFTLIPDPVFERLGPYIGGIVKNFGGTLLGFGGMPDHIHLLVSLGRDRTIADVLKGIKAYSSKWMHETFLECGGFAWQAGYGAFTVSPSAMARVKQYIANQREHHTKRTYAAELKWFLQEYGVEYEEKWMAES